MASSREIVAAAFARTGLSSLGRVLQAKLVGPHVRIVNYHDVPPSRAGAFERQIERLAEHFEPVALDDIIKLHEERWTAARPGLLLTFDDGLRSHHDVVAPILERYGFRGCFFVPVGFVDTPPEQQAEWARAHEILVADEYQDHRVALTWDETRELDARHVVGGHTWDHVRLRSGLPPEVLRREIADARERLGKELGHPVDVFAWVGGEESSYSAEAARAIREAGFRFSMMTNNAVVRPTTDLRHLQRTNLEARFPEALVDLSLSGFYDLLYTAKRRRVDRLTSETLSVSGG